jgi:hypothetical protein
MRNKVVEADAKQGMRIKESERANIRTREREYATKASDKRRHGKVPQAKGHFTKKYLTFL